MPKKGKVKPAENEDADNSKSFNKRDESTKASEKETEFDLDRKVELRSSIVDMMKETQKIDELHSADRSAFKQLWEGRNPFNRNIHKQKFNIMTNNNRVSEFFGRKNMKKMAKLTRSSQRSFLVVIPLILLAAEEIVRWERISYKNEWREQVYFQTNRYNNPQTGFSGGHPWSPSKTGVPMSQNCPTPSSYIANHANFSSYMTYEASSYYEPFFTGTFHKPYQWGDFKTVRKTLGSIFKINRVRMSFQDKDYTGSRKPLMLLKNGEEKQTWKDMLHGAFENVKSEIALMGEIRKRAASPMAWDYDSKYFSENQVPGSIDNEGRIIGGSQIDIGDAPWSVSMRYPHYPDPVKWKWLITKWDNIMQMGIWPATAQWNKNCASDQTSEWCQANAKPYPELPFPIIYRHFCGGSLIASQYMLSAAHCWHGDLWKPVRFTDKENLDFWGDRIHPKPMSQDETEWVKTRVYIGGNGHDPTDSVSPVSVNAAAADAQIAYSDGADSIVFNNGDLSHGIEWVKLCIAYEEMVVWGGTSNFDIAVIKLDAPVTFSGSIQPACIPPQSPYSIIDYEAGRETETGKIAITAPATDFHHETGYDCYTTGWGANTPVNGRYSTFLKSTGNQEIKGRDTCLEILQNAMPQFRDPMTNRFGYGHIEKLKKFVLRWRGDYSGDHVTNVHEQWVYEDEDTHGQPYARKPYDIDHALCSTAGRVGGEAPCAGDGGAGLVCIKSTNASEYHQQENWYLDGIASWGSSHCALEGIPTVYTKVQDWSSWIWMVIEADLKWPDWPNSSKLFWYWKSTGCGKYGREGNYNKQYFPGTYNEPYSGWAQYNANKQPDGEIQANKYEVHGCNEDWDPAFNECLGSATGAYRSDRLLSIYNGEDGENYHPHWNATWGSCAAYWCDEDDK